MPVNSYNPIPHGVAPRQSPNMLQAARQRYGQPAIPSNTGTKSRPAYRANLSGVIYPRHFRQSFNIL